MLKAIWENALQLNDSGELTLALCSVLEDLQYKQMWKMSEIVLRAANLDRQSSQTIHPDDGGPLPVEGSDSSMFAYIDHYIAIVNLEYGIASIDNYSRVIHETLFSTEPVRQEKVKNRPSWLAHADNTALTMSWIDQLFLAGQGFGNKYVVPRLLTFDGFLEDIRNYGNCDTTAHDRVLLLNALNANRVNHSLPILEGHHIDWETNLEKARIAAMKKSLMHFNSKLTLCLQLNLWLRPRLLQEQLA